jgi:hypothetical protein
MTERGGASDSSLRRKPESRGFKEEFDVYTIMALLVTLNSSFLMIFLFLHDGNKSVFKRGLNHHEIEDLHSLLFEDLSNRFLSLFKIIDEQVDFIPG